LESLESRELLLLLLLLGLWTLPDRLELIFVKKEKSFGIQLVNIASWNSCQYLEP
jgi:hypothetical protein